MDIRISFDFDNEMTSTSKVIRNKGKSIIDFPDTYVLLDTETTGLNPQYDSLLEIGAIKVLHGEVVDSFNTLITLEEDQEVSEFITNLTGITTEMILEYGISKEQALTEFMEFVGNHLVLGYNVSFDINFIYDAWRNISQQDFSNDFIDVMRISRKVFPELKHHRLKDMKTIFEISEEQEHRGLSDCYLTKNVYDQLLEKIKIDNLPVSSFKRSKRSANDITTNILVFDETNPFFGKQVCFTGKMDCLVRKDAQQLIADLGGTPQDGVNKSTNFLVIGDTAYSVHVKDGITGKMKKANNLIEKGADLSVITESTFIDMIQEY